MRCLLCCEEMKLVKAEPHEVINLAGFERHIYECTACHETEERLVFNRGEGREVTETVSTVPADPPPAGADDEDRERLKRLFRKIKISISRG